MRSISCTRANRSAASPCSDERPRTSATAFELTTKLGVTTMSKVAIHPSVDGGVQPGAPNFAGGTLTCKCGDRQVTVKLEGDVAFNHACGCTKCWKPQGALFSVVAVISRDKVKVTANQDKLKIVDPAAVIQRYA